MTTPDPAAVEALAIVIDKTIIEKNGFGWTLARAALTHLLSLGWRPPAPSTVEPRGCAMPGCCSAISAGWRPPAPEAGREEHSAPSPDALRQVREVLLELEWSVPMDQCVGCPICEGILLGWMDIPGGHKPGCKLAAAIALLPEATP